VGPPGFAPSIGPADGAANFTFNLDLALSVVRITQLFCLFTLCFFGSGCRLFHNAWLTTIAEPIQYSRDVYDMRVHRRFGDLAAYALDEAMSLARAELDDYCREPFSADYQLGFLDGFVDFLEAGGTGNPSPLPPRRYWKAKYQTPDGYQCAQDWFRGFQHGSGAAQASNYRSFVTVPLSDFVTAGTMPYACARIAAVEQEKPEAGHNETSEVAEGDVADRRHARVRETGTHTNRHMPRVTRLPEISTMY
jgi:hypothetical protein